LPQTKPVQFALTQSPATVQALPPPQRIPEDPPQSMSVSVPFLTPSLFVGAAHVPVFVSNAHAVLFALNEVEFADSVIGPGKVAATPAVPPVPRLTPMLAAAVFEFVHVLQ
jgi:hypothetical protein